MKRSFVRLVWGDCTVNGLRGGKLLKDIQYSIEVENFDCAVYVLGKDNCKLLTEMGLTCVLINDSPYVYDVEVQQYAHKLYLINCAMDDFDEMAYLDWDCRAIKNVPDNVWNILNKKEVFQANLLQYRTKKCLWRTEEKRKTCNGGFLYMRDKAIPAQFIKNYNELYEWTMQQQTKRQSMGKDLRFREKCLIFDDEPAITKYVDDLTNGWCGVDYYWNNFEPDICNLQRKSAFSDEDNAGKKDVYFSHGVKK